MGEMKVINKEVELYRKFKEGKNKPKLKKLFDLVELTPNPFQEQVIKYIDEEYKNWSNLMLSSSRRSGKSKVTGLLTVLEMLIPNSSVLLVAPSNKQLGIIFDEVLKIIRQLNLPIDKLDTNGKYIRLQNNARFMGGSETNISNLEGQECSMLLLEEVYLIKSIKRILASLSPALSTYGVYEDTKMPVGKTIMLGSVKSGNLEAKEYYDRGMRHDKGYVTLKFTAYQNPLLSKDFLEAEREKLGDELFRQEYLCEFVGLYNTLALRDFDYNKNTCDMSFIRSNIDKDSILISGLDIGASDSTSYVLFYYEAGKYYLIDHFNNNNISEKEIAQNIKEVNSKYPANIELNFVDPSAKLTRIGLANDHDLLFFPAKNAIKESIALLNQLFREGRLFIDRDMTNVIKQIQNLMWRDNLNKGTGDPFKKNSDFGHFDDIASIRYAIFTHYTQYVNTGEIITI
jgi:hypothetical protein